MTAVLLTACSGVPPVVDLDAGRDAGEQRVDAGLDGGPDAGLDGGVDAGPVDAGCSGGCGASCAACGALQMCEAGACVYFDRVRFSYATKPLDAGNSAATPCTFNIGCIETRDFAQPRRAGIVNWYRDAGCALSITPGDGITTPDVYRIDCDTPFCRPFNPSTNCCRTTTPGGGDGVCGWSPP